MGVKLQDLLIRKTIAFQTLEGKIIAVDAPNIIMGLFNFARKNPDGSYAGFILDRTQRPISHLYGLLYRINFYYFKRIFPIFCFDGRDSELKKVITKDRLKNFRFTQKWYEEAIKNSDKTAARHIALSKEYMWQNILLESKQLLGALGVPFIESPASAESQCAYLVKEGIAHYSNSQDFDSLLFGCPHMIQNLSKSLRRKVQGKWKYTKINPLSIDLRKNLKKLEINQFQLVDLGLLVGTDYFPGIKGIGPKKALEYIKEYKQIEKVLSSIDKKFDVSTLTSEVIKEVRKTFLFPEVNKSTENFHWNFPHKPFVIDLLCKKHHLSRERVEKNLEKLFSHYQNCRDYFLKLQNKPRSIQLTLDKINI
jgi:flap endonuclease-1